MTVLLHIVGAYMALSATFTALVATIAWYENYTGQLA